MKNIFSLIVSFVLLAAFAFAVAETPVISKIEYEGNGFIEIDFKKDVSYQNLSIQVLDASGREYLVEVYERDEDDLSFRADGLQPGMGYEIIVSGVLSGREGNYESVSAEITVPEAGIPAVQHIEYDAGDSELEIEFSEKVDFENPQVTITDANGTTYQTRLLKTEKDGLDVYVSGLNIGSSYTAQISGVSLRGQANYQSISTEFIALDD